jgi:hypothetical protein
MTDKGMNSLLSSSFKLGADASIAVGPVGAGAKSDILVRARVSNKDAAALLSAIAAAAVAP